MNDEKYIVFKREEFSHWWGQVSVGGTEHPRSAPEALEDAVVIRLQDEFAESGLSAYAMNIQTVLDIISPDSIGTGAYRSLEAARDYFYACSMDAGEIRRRGQAKLPD